MKRLYESFYDDNIEQVKSGPLLIAGVKSRREVGISQRFRSLGQHVVIAEPFAANVTKARDLHHHAMVMHCAVQDVPDLSRFRTVVWLQGPEHVHMDVAKAFFREAMLTADLIVLEMPHGFHPQGADGGNPYEVHVSSWFPKDFDDMGTGWRISCSHDGKPKADPNSNNNRHLLAVWSR